MKKFARSIRSKECRNLLKRYPRAIVHMRQQHASRQLGLVFGAGIGKPFGFPAWSELLQRIAKHPEVNGGEIMTRSKNATIQAQQLFQNFKNRAAQTAADDTFVSQMRMRSKWRTIVRNSLYEGVPVNEEDLIKCDKYLIALMPVIRKSRLTVTYNFDDLLERLLAYSRDDSQSPNQRGYTTFWSGNVQLQAKEGAVYHPNGFLPFALRDRPSDTLVFLEDSFADQLIDSVAGHYANLSAHMSQTTCLFIGLSLDDPTLKHLLRQSAHSYPGHYHYFVQYVDDGQSVSPSHQNIERQANFDVYNLNTLHLTSADLTALAFLLDAEEDDFKLVCEEEGVSNSYRYFVTGSVSVGKSTLVSHYRMLRTQDEWTEQRPPAMDKDPSTLSEEELDSIDGFVAEQIAKKNENLRSAGSGIHMIDRAPLDAFAFTPLPLWSKKAKRLREAVTPGKAKGRTLLPGHVILLIGEPTIMAARAASLDKTHNENNLAEQQRLFRDSIYGMLPTGVSQINTLGMTASQVAKEVATIVYFNEYTEADLDGQLTQFLQLNTGKSPTE